MTAYPIELIRASFPALENSGTAFLDNPAGTLVSRVVIEAVAEAMATASSNLGGRFAASQRADAVWRAAHEAAAEFVNATSWQEIVIGPNMTTLAFQMARVIGQTFAPGDEIIVTRMDHEGNVSPWLSMAEAYGLVVKWLPFNKETWRIEPEDLAALLTPRTKFLALNYASNMTGSINDVAALTALARAAGALVWIDAVQLAPHRLPDVQAIGCDFLVCSSYKFFGPHLGVLWGRAALLRDLPPHRVRCQSDDIPDRFCTGTPQTELLAGLTATIDYLAWAGETTGSSGTRRERMAGAYQAFDAYEAGLTRRLVGGLTALPGVRLAGIANPNLFAHRVPTISFTHDRISTHRFADALAAEDINIWSGHNYALEPARHLGLSEEEGVVRIGIAHYNTADEIERALAAIGKLVA
ncbi:cysteine desulfurase-like protein [Shinella kummerowiae]|jgi:cysteine desulfurase family protein (TIGR01976 family)|uniref:Cysteine desulfurase-like protein n=1 Tax=Shinella kummerowiae TaxID=417745 RepID=A0A6N8SFQ3_9HYPH|nr:cysteine desulfurase-like protein [Shinella kummerowiae]MXN46438.1 cysteine desulfurase-like protein [Shinella kummerowiae]